MPEKFRKVKDEVLRQTLTEPAAAQACVISVLSQSFYLLGRLSLFFSQVCIHLVYVGHVLNRNQRAWGERPLGN